jgi:hypothetical protein
MIVGSSPGPVKPKTMKFGLPHDKFCEVFSYIPFLDVNN